MGWRYSITCTNIAGTGILRVAGSHHPQYIDGALADMGRTRRHQIRELAADSDIPEAVKIAARAHQKLVWERTRHLLRMRSALRDYFPAALDAYADLGLTGTDTLELLAKAPDPESAARLTASRVTAALRRAGRRGDLGDIRAVLRAPRLAQPAVITEAYAASVKAQAAVVAALNTQAKAMEAKVSEFFAVTLMPGSTCPSPASGTSPGPGSSASSATRPAATRPPRPAGTTRAPRR